MALAGSADTHAPQKMFPILFITKNFLIVLRNFPQKHFGVHTDILDYPNATLLKIQFFSSVLSNCYALFGPPTAQQDPIRYPSDT